MEHPAHPVGERLQCGQRARARYELLFSGAALGRAYVKLYQSVVNRDGKPMGRVL